MFVGKEICTIAINSTNLYCKPVKTCFIVILQLVCLYQYENSVLCFLFRYQRD